uniref:Uncharacterized protein n=1 Tax=viral metagenome TaxID=1070528 RepID=A0A6M3LLG6_9ZZZZ
MTDRAINLRDWEVRALLAGAAPKRWGADVIVRPIVPPPPCAPGDNDDIELLLVLGEIKAPYAVGDVLWGREAWRTEMVTGAVYSGAAIRYAADDRLRHVEFAEYEAWEAAHATQRDGWRSSTHMPRWACRVQRTVVKVEPLQVRDIRAAVIERMGFDVAAKLPLIPLPSCFDSVIDAVADKLFSEQWDADWPEYPYADSPWGWMYEVRA